MLFLYITSYLSTKKSDVPLKVTVIITFRLPSVTLTALSVIETNTGAATDLGSGKNVVGCEAVSNLVL